MKKWLTKVIKAVPFSLLATLLVGITVLAAAYSAPLTITETNGTAYDMLPVITDAPVQWMVDNDYMDADGLDTLAETAGGVTKPHMVVDDKVLTATAIPADSQTNLVFSTENTPLSSTDIITGYDGYITMDDDATLELGSDFEIEQSGYIDTDAGADKNLVYKDSAFRTYIDGATNITSKIEAWEETETLVPDGAGSQTNLRLFGGATNWQACVTNDGDAEYVYIIWNDAPNPDYDLYSTTDSTVDDWRVIDNVTIYNVSKWDTSVNGATSETVLRTNGQTYYGNVENLTNAYVTYSTVYTNNPQTTAPWTWAEVDAMEIGVRLTKTVADEARCTQVYAVVTYDYEEVSATATSIDSGEYTVKTYGVANEPAWATGDVLRFDGDNDVVSVADHASIANPFDGGGSIDVWLNPDSDGGAAAGRIINKNKWQVHVFGEAAGKIKIRWAVDFTGVNGQWDTDDTQLIIGEWNHFVITYDADAVGNDPIFYVNGTTLTVGDGITEVVTPTLARQDDAGLLYIGNTGGFNRGWDGLISDVRIYDTILTTATVADHYAGDYSDRTNLIAEWYIDEGIGTAIPDYSVNTNEGTLAGAVWETSTYTTGKTGRLCDFYIEVDDGVTDADRWGANLKGTSVADNGNDWILNQNNVMPYMDYYKHTVSGVEHAWYQPNYIVESTSYTGTADAGGDTDTIIDAELTQANDYWNNALVTITETTDHNAPEGETAVVSDFAAATDEITLATALSAGVDAGDTYTVDFGTLIDRSYYGLDFDGVNDEVTFPAQVIPTSEFTVSLWVKGTGTGGGGMGVWVGTVGGPGWPVGYEKTSERIFFGCAEGNLDSEINLPDQTNFHQVVVTWDGTTLTLYIDGVYQNDWAKTFAPATNTRLGTTGGSNFANSEVDEILIFDRVLEQPEITYNYNEGDGRYAIYDTTGLVLQLHMEEGSGANVADTSGEGNNGTITGATWVNGKVPRPAGNAGTNDSRITWGVNPTGISSSLSSLVSEDQPGLATPIDEPARDVMPEIETSNWFVEPDISGSLATNPLRPFVTLVSDNTTLTELQTWRWLGIAIVLLVIVTTAKLVPKHLAIACFAGGAGTLLMVVMTIWPLWTLVILILFALGGWVSERSPSV